MSYNLYKKNLFLLLVISAAVIMKIYLKKKNQLTKIIKNQLKINQKYEGVIYIVAKEYVTNLKENMAEEKMCRKFRLKIIDFEKLFH